MRVESAAIACCFQMSTKVYFFIFSLTIINVISANPVMSDAADLNIDFDEIAPDFKIQETFDDANCEIDNSAVHISDEILENDQSEDLVRRQTKACPASRIKLPWTKFKTPWRAPSKMPQPEVDPSDRQIVLGSAHRLCIDELMPQLVSCSGPTIDHMSVTTSGYVLNCLPGKTLLWDSNLALVVSALRSLDSTQKNDHLQESNP